METQYDPEQPAYGEVVLTADDFLEPDDKGDEVPVLEILDTGVTGDDEEWEPDIVERGWEPSEMEKAAAHAYAYTTVTGFRMLESSLKATFSTLEFLARRL